MSGFVQVVLGGLVEGCVYALIALGMSVVYSISRIINLAQGGFVVLAALTAVSLQQHLRLPPLAVVPIVVVLFALLLAAVDRVVMLPGARRATPDRMLLITVGLLQAIGSPGAARSCSAASAWSRSTSGSPAPCWSPSWRCGTC